jgi:mono/diheme cytochrome c family protein
MAEIKEDHNKTGMIAFVFSMVVAVGFFVYLIVLHPGVDLGENIKAPEVVTEVAGPAFDIATVKEPWIENADVAKYGKNQYAANCAMCHGAEAKGDGAAGAALNPKPRNLVEGGWKQGGDSISLFKTLTGGVPGSSMPAFGHFSTADRWALVQFIRSITKDKPADDAAALSAFAASAK